MIKLTPEILRKAAEIIAKSECSEYMCLAVDRVLLRQMPDVPYAEACDISYALIESSFKPYLIRDGIPIDGTWLYRMGREEHNSRRAEYLRSLADELDKSQSCT